MIICAELLEHVPEPQVVLSEMNRVLVNSGYVLITTPFIYRMHGDPSDYARYTSQYWSLILAKAGFDRAVIENQGSFFSVCLDFVKQYFNETKSHPLRDIYQLFCMTLQKWVHRLEQRKTSRNQAFIDSFTTGYGVLARKR